MGRPLLDGLILGNYCTTDCCCVVCIVISIVVSRIVSSGGRVIIDMLCAVVNDDLAEVHACGEGKGRPKFHTGDPRVTCVSHLIGEP